MILEVRDENRGNASVIVNDLAFGKSGGRVEHFVEIGQLKLFAFDFDDLVGGHKVRLDAEAFQCG